MTVVVATIIPGEGTLFAIKVSAAFVTVAEVQEINGVKVSVAGVDVTSLTSALHLMRPSKLPKPEEMTAKIWYDPADTASQNLLSGDANAPGTIRDFQITFINDAFVVHGTATFSGFITGFELNGLKNEENVGADVSIQLTTLVTYTGGSAT